MKKLLVLIPALLIGQTPIFDLNTPPRLNCKADLVGANIVLTCGIVGKAPMVTTMPVASIEGDPWGVFISYNSGSDSILSSYVKKLPTDKIKVTVTVNGGPLITKEL